MNDTGTKASARPFPLAIDEITPEWLSTLFQVQIPAAAVRGFEILDIFRGSCTTLRLKLDVDEAGTEAGIPKTVMLKSGYENHSRKTEFMLKSESLAYRYLDPSSGLNGPKCYFADYDGEIVQGVILMEDLADRKVRFANSRNPLSHDQVASTLSLLARYHSRTWNCPEFKLGDPLDWVISDAPFTPARRPRSWLAPEIWNDFASMPRGAVFSRPFRDCKWAIDALDRMEALSARLPKVVGHGDAHMGNVFFAADGMPGFVDTLPRRLPPMCEVTFHATIALDPADRRNWDRALVRHYLDELRVYGIADAPSLDDAMHQFSVFLVEAYCAVMTNSSDIMDEASITAYAARCNAAMLDNDTIGQIGRIET